MSTGAAVDLSPYASAVSNLQYCHTTDIELYNSIVEQQHKQPYVYKALQLAIDCIKKYTLPHIAFSFNGGKDCTVILHILRAACAHLQLSLSDIVTVYFKVPHEFQEIEQFMLLCQQLYQLDFQQVTGDYQSALHTIFQQRKQQQQTPITAIFMGQRRHDPYCDKLSTITPTDSTWPPFDRLNLCIDWTYEQIWTFLIDFNLIYCKLYDLGYTSIGNTLDSVPNPALRIDDTDTYMAAYQLTDATLERKSRTERVRHDKQQNGGDAAALNESTR